jgi:hypothetical protein
LFQIHDYKILIEQFKIQNLQYYLSLPCQL